MYVHFFYFTFCNSAEAVNLFSEKSEERRDGQTVSEKWTASSADRSRAI